MKMATRGLSWLLICIFAKPLTKNECSPILSISADLPLLSNSPPYKECFLTSHFNFISGKILPDSVPFLPLYECILRQTLYFHQIRHLTGGVSAWYLILNFRQPSGKCSPNAPFSPDLPFLSNLPFSSIIEATGRLLTSHSNFHQSSSSPLRAFLSYFKTLSSVPTPEIEPMAYCWFTRDVTAPNVGDQEQKCRSLLRTKKVLLITNVSTLSHDCKLSVRTCA